MKLLTSISIIIIIIIITFLDAQCRVNIVSNNSRHNEATLKHVNTGDLFAESFDTSDQALSVPWAEQ